jgi:hypothetical protein
MARRSRSLWSQRHYTVDTSEWGSELELEDLQEQ